MANELSHRHTATGSTLYVTIRDTSRQMYNGVGWESCTAANWTDYDVALTEGGATNNYLYSGDFPAVSAGWYWVDVFEQAGGSPVISDDLLASYFGYWDGTTFAWWSQNTQSHSTGAITASAIAGDAITSAKIADDAIAAEHIAAGAIVAATFAAGAIDAAAIADDAIDAATMADDMQAWLATYVWNAKTASYGVAGDFGTVVKDWLDGGRLDVILDELTTQGDTNETKLDTIDGVVDSNATKLDAIDGIVDDILLDTQTIELLNNLSQADIRTAIGMAAADLDTQLDAIVEDTGTTLPATLSTMDGKIDTVDGIVDSILEDTGTTIPATITTIDTLLDKMAPALIGTVTGAGTGTEVFVYGGVTATYTVDASGNRTEVAFS